ncbi:MAG: right-handed parallel beta-helix repeat-containing protein [Candidatus Eiseniibacteriota bacterium]
MITESGAYRVVQDFTATQDGIVILANDVQLSLGGYTITGPGNKVGRGIVVDGARNASIAGGTVRTFGVGVALLGTSGSSVRDVTVEGGDETAAPPANPPQIGLLLVNSWQNTLVDNELSRVNLGIFVRGGGSFENRIQQNTMTAGTNGLLAICYNPAMGQGPAGPTRDKVTNNVLDGFGTGIQTSSGSPTNRFVANRIRFLDLAWQDLNGTNVFVGNKTEALSP